MSLHSAHKRVDFMETLMDRKWELMPDLLGSSQQLFLLILLA